MAITVRLKNINPLGAVDLPLIGRVLEPGEEFDVDTRKQADELLAQTGNYEEVKTSTTTTKDKG